MQIGYDISQTGKNKAGCGYFAHALIQALFKQDKVNKYSLYPGFGDFFFDFYMSISNPYPSRNSTYGRRHLTKESAAKYWTNKNLEKKLGNPDIIHSNNYWCPTQLSSTKLIYTFYDLGFTIDPTWTTETNRIGGFDGVFKSSIAADWVVAISQASKQHYLRTFPHFPEDRIRVIYPCSRFASSDMAARKPRTLDGIAPGQFWLSVGTIEPRKNQRRLIEAYARYLSLGGTAMPLVLAGGKGWLMEDFQNYIDSFGIQQHVLSIGYVSDEELIWLYKNCYANLYPSLFEGFGLPVLEGMQFGAPTLVSNTSSLPEVAGEGAITLTPSDSEAWAQTMLRISKNTAERDFLSDAGRKQADRFSWENSASNLLELYTEASNSPRRYINI